MLMVTIRMEKKTISIAIAGVLKEILIQEEIDTMMRAEGILQTTVTERAEKI